MSLEATSMSDKVELRFSLDVQKNWPPVAVEALPFEVCSTGYLSTVPPLFVKGLSVGDVIVPQVDGEGFVSAWRHVSKSPNSVVWLLRIAPTEQIEEVLANLRALTCNTASLPQAGVYSIDVPGRVQFENVDAILATLNSDEVAAAYPSFRHADPEEIEKE